MSQSLSRGPVKGAPQTEDSDFWTEFQEEFDALMAANEENLEAANIIDGTEGNDRIGGTRDADQINLLGGNDVARGGAGDDEIFGGGGADTIRAGAGNDTLDGGSGGDDLIGGNGDDYIDGGTGNDFIRTGGGNDTIHFATGDGGDVIADFNRRGDDTLEIDAVGFDSFDDILAPGVLQDAGNSTIIWISETDAIRLIGVSSEDLTADDFVFV